MSAAIVNVTLHLERHDHSKSLTNETAMEMAESELDGTDWWDDDYQYKVTVTSAEVVVDKAR